MKKRDLLLKGTLMAGLATACQETVPEIHLDGDNKPHEDNPGQQVQKRPNVLFIMCDDLNDYEGVFGGHPQARTPNLDRLARSGIQFVNAQCNAAISMPSRNSLFTGVYPFISKDYGWTRRKEQAVLKHNKTFLHLFKENGYYMAGTGKLLHVNEMDIWDQWGVPNKYDYGPYVRRGGENVAHPDVPAPFRNIGAVDGSYGRLSTAGALVYSGNEFMKNNSRDDRGLLPDEQHAEWAVRKIQELDRNPMKKPFFLGVGFVRPHTPLYAPDEFFDLFPLESLNLADWIADDDKDTPFQQEDYPDSKGYKYYRTLVESYGGNREIALKTYLQAYLACIAFADAQIGKVLDALENSRFKDNTIIVFVSDHGWQMGEKNYLYKNSPWEESMRIPMIFKVPGMAAGMKIEQPVSLIDIYPTLKDLCDLKGSNKMDPAGGESGGYTMLPLMNGGKWEGPEGALSIVAVRGTYTTHKAQHFSYRTKDFRYIIYPDGKEELYDHRNDPHEWYNLASNADQKDRISGFYSNICSMVGQPLNRK